MIRLIAMDIDGVFTDGRVDIHPSAQESKRISTKDLDALTEMRASFKTACITGEDTPVVVLFKERLKTDYFLSGCKEKLAALQRIGESEGIELREMAYIGDGKYDVEAMKAVGLAVCPADAIDDAKEAAHVVLRRNGGEGCIDELLRLVKRENAGRDGLAGRRIQEHITIFEDIRRSPTVMESIDRACTIVAERIKNDGTLFLCGNGGSAADAQHIAAEFVGRFYRERKALSAEALTANTSILTALGNDYGFDVIFRRQLEGRARSGDALIGLSTSGASANVLEALRYAKSIGMRTVALVGSVSSEALRRDADCIVAVPSSDTPRIQEAHIFIGHIISEYVEAELFGEKSQEAQ